MQHETSILNNTTFWYGVAAFVFWAFVILKGRAPLMGWLDGEIAKVRAELDEAKRLHAEAEATLAEYRNRQKEAAKEAELIIEEAKKDAARLREEAAVELKEAIERHEQLFVDRIKLAHEEAIDEVRAFVIEEALNEARGKLSKLATSSQADKLVDGIIDELPKLQKSKVA